MSAQLIPNVVCSFCGCLCDDLDVIVESGKIVDVRHACSLGYQKIISSQDPSRLKRPLMREGSSWREISLEEAIRETAKILTRAKRPLLYGWSSTSCEAQAAGIRLAEVLRAVIDNTTTVCHGPSILAYQNVGLSLCTLGEIKNRADLIVYWGSNPFIAHPRHMSRYTIYPRGFFREGGWKDRILVVVDTRETETAKLASYFVKVKPGYDYEFLTALRMIVNGMDIKANEVGGVPKSTIVKIAKIMKECHFGVLFFGVGLTMSDGKHRNVENALALVRDLNKYTKFVVLPMRGHYNVAGFNEVAGWISGYPFAIDYSRGYSRYNPGETSAVDILLREEIDAVLLVGSDLAAHFPPSVSRLLASIDTISITPFMNLSAKLSKIIIPSAIVGVEVEGTAYRMDNVPIRLKKIVDPPSGVLSDEEIINRILAEVLKLKGAEIVARTYN